MLPSGCMHARSKKGFHIIDGGRGREMEAEAEGARFFSLFRKKRRSRGIVPGEERRRTIADGLNSHLKICTPHSSGGGVAGPSETFFSWALFQQV
jgi:predicted Rossmann-fold nucleotide-binding protein